MTLTEIEKRWELLQALRDAAETALGTFREKVQELVKDLHAYMDEHSDKWLKGGTVEAGELFVDELENLEREIPKVPKLNP